MLKCDSAFAMEVFKTGAEVRELHDGRVCVSKAEVATLLKS